MANITIGCNIGSFNPYSLTVTNSGTLVGSDIELVISTTTATPISKQDILLALEAFEQFYSQSLGPGAEGQGAAPP